MAGFAVAGLINCRKSCRIYYVMDVVSRRTSLTVWCRLYGFNESTISKMHLGGKLSPELQVEQLPNGWYYVTVLPENDGRCVIYARVSSNDQGEDLDRQVGRATEWATRPGFRPDEVVKEIGSGLNGNLRKLRRLVADHTVRTILVEHRERLCRFAFEYLDAALAGRGASIVVMDDAEVDDDPVRDVTEVMNSRSSRTISLWSMESTRLLSAMAGLWTESLSVMTLTAPVFSEGSSHCVRRRWRSLRISYHVWTNVGFAFWPLLLLSQFGWRGGVIPVCCSEMAFSRPCWSRYRSRGWLSLYFLSWARFFCTQGSQRSCP